MLLLAFLFFSETVSVGEVLLPVDMSYGFSAESAGRFLIGEKRGEKEVRLVRCEFRNGGMRKLFEFPRKFEGPLELFAVRDGVIVGDYASGFLGAFSLAGEETWQVKVRDPNVFRLSLDGTPWMFFNSLMVYRKTPDSSEVEPVLDKDGAEILLPGPADIAPVRGEAFYLLDSQGDIYEYPEGGSPRVLARGVRVRRILAHPSGGVLGYGEGEVVWFRRDGSRRVVYRVSLEWAKAIRQIAWMPDGTLALSGSITEQGGRGSRGILLMIKIDRLGAD